MIEIITFFKYFVALLSFTYYYGVSIPIYYTFNNSYLDTLIYKFLLWKEVLYINNEDITIKYVYLHINKGYKIDITKKIFGNKFGYSDFNDFSDDIIEDDEFEFYLLEIIYTFKDKQYKILYADGEPIIFPPFVSDDECKESILYAGYGNNDITDLIKEYSGPLGNFYNNIGVSLTMEKLNFIMHDTQTLVIIDSNGDEKQFIEGEIY